jgi:hypothetical protein
MSTRRATIGKLFNWGKSEDGAGLSLGTRGSHSGGAMLWDRRGEGTRKLLQGVEQMGGRTTKTRRTEELMETFPVPLENCG